ncbi:MAG: substrate-binding domain-containing protein [Bacteroidetes bacterium]|nr:substrate-binding domain-containing protein [Bacteroidota bacterium]
MLICVISCNDDPKPVVTPTTIHISVDESFKPVIDEQVKVFEALHPKLTIVAHYKPEAECIKDLNVDSISMVIITRGLTTEEEIIMKNKLTFVPRYGKLAFDAVAVLVNKASKDTLFDMADLRSLVKGTSGYKYKVVLDGLSATSTVRYVQDSLAGGAPLGKNVMGAAGSEGVINYISNNTDAVGLVGVSWVGNPEDTAQVQLQRKLHIAGVECLGCQPVKYVYPVQYNIATRRYPLVRPLFYILKENYEGVASGFAAFLIYEKGQKIFSRSYLWPARMRLEVRQTKINP